MGLVLGGVVQGIDLMMVAMPRVLRRAESRALRCWQVMGMAVMREVMPRSWMRVEVCIVAVYIMS